MILGIEDLTAEHFWAGIITAGFMGFSGLLMQFLQARVAQNKLKSDAAIESAKIKAAAVVAADAAKVKAEETASEAWRTVAGEYRARVASLESQNAGQQRQINILASAADANTGKISELVDQHQACIEKHAECETAQEQLKATHKADTEAMKARLDIQSKQIIDLTGSVEQIAKDSGSDVKVIKKC